MHAWHAFELRIMRTFELRIVRAFGLCLMRAFELHIMHASVPRALVWVHALIRALRYLTANLLEFSVKITC